MSLPLLLVGKQVIIQPGLQAFEQAVLLVPSHQIYPYIVLMLALGQAIEEGMLPLMLRDQLVK